MSTRLVPFHSSNDRPATEGSPGCKKGDKLFAVMDEQRGLFWKYCYANEKTANNAMTHHKVMDRAKPGDLRRDFEALKLVSSSSTR